MSWETLQLGEFLTLKRGYDLPSSQRKEGDVPIVSSSGITGRHNVAKVEGPGVVTGRYGTLGEVFFVDEDYWPLNTALYVQDFKGNNRRFSAYFLKSVLAGTTSDKAAVPGVNRNDLHARKVTVTRDTGQQSAIASILSAYDDLIENNRRRIQLLEQAARLLYREWFVHLHFPDHEHAKIKDGVPEGWEKKTLSKVLFELESGGRPKGGAQEDGIPSVGAENVIGIGQYHYSKEKYVPETYFNSMRKGIIQSRDVLVYKDGANIGRSSYFGDGYPHETCAVNEHVFILRASPQVGQNLLYFWVERDETRQRIANLNANTAQPGVSQSKLKTLDFVVPQDRIASMFNETVEPIVRQIFLLAKEIQALINARDLLLPRLMDGEVTV